MTRICPICSSTDKKLLYVQRFNGDAVSLMGAYDVVACKACGFAFADNIPAQNEFDRYYALQSKYEFNHQDGQVSTDYLSYFTKIFHLLEKHIGDKKAKILDIGCSTGALLSIFMANGYFNLLGIDPSPACVKTAGDLYNIQANANSLSNFRTNEKFDVVILSAVLEHLVDFDDSFEKIRELLNDGGILFVEVPDAERFEAFITSPFQQFSTEHINYFTKYSIQNLLAKYNFEVVQVKENANKLNLIMDPDLFVVGKKANDCRFTLTIDRVPLEKLERYIKKCSELDKEIKKDLGDKINCEDKIIVWGVGTHTLRLIGAGLDLSKILYFVDSNRKYHGMKIKGIEIKSPDEITEGENKILISSYGYQKEITSQIKNTLKLKNKIIHLYRP